MIQRLHQRHNSAAVYPRGKKSPHRHIRHHLIPDRSLQKPLQLLRRFLPASRKQILLPLLRRIHHRPERFYRRPGKRSFQRQDTPRLQLPYILINRIRSRNIPMHKINIQHIPVDFITKTIQNRNRSNIRPKHKTPVYKTIIQRLLPDPIPKQIKPSLLLIIKRNGKHPLTQRDRLFDPHMLHSLQKNLRIRTPPETIHLLLLNQPLCDLPVIIDFTIKDHFKPPAVRLHRLRPIFRKIHNRKPLMPQNHIPVLTRPNPRSIRPPMPHPLIHLPDILLPIPLPITKPCNPAHNLTRFLKSRLFILLQLTKSLAFFPFLPLTYSLHPALPLLFSGCPSACCGLALRQESSRPAPGKPAAARDEIL